MLTHRKYSERLKKKKMWADFDFLCFFSSSLFHFVCRFFQLQNGLHNITIWQKKRMNFSLFQTWFKAILNYGRSFSSFNFIFLKFLEDVPSFQNSMQMFASLVILSSLFFNEKKENEIESINSSIFYIRFGLIFWDIDFATETAHFIICDRSISASTVASALK